jgi:hypothetical protein
MEERRRRTFRPKRETWHLLRRPETLSSIAHSFGSETYSRTFNVLADCLSRFHNPVNTEWELQQVVFDSVVLRWDRPHVDFLTESLPESSQA